MTMLSKEHSRGTVLFPRFLIKLRSLTEHPVCELHPFSNENVTINRYYLLNSNVIKILRERVSFYHR